MTIGERTRPETCAPASLQPGVDPVEARDARLQVSRRLDWRFLLPSPTLGRVVYFGPADGALPDALKQFSVSLADAADAATAAAGSFDLAVVSGPSEHALTTAARLVRPGGHVYVECETASVRSRRCLRPRAVRRILHRLGLAAPHTALHWPDFERCTRIIPLEPATLRQALTSGMPGGAAGALVSALVRPSLVEHVAPAISVTAGKGTPPMTMGASFLAERRDGLPLQRLGVAEGGASTLITPRFRASSHVISLVLTAGTLRPALALKTARLPGDRHALDREAANLRALQASRAEGFDTIPRVLLYEDYRSHPLLAETALTGVPMTRSVVRRRPGQCCEAMLEWLVDVHVATRREPDCDWHERLVSGPLGRLTPILDVDPGSGEMMRVTKTVAARLRQARLPLVFEHGDLSHPNIFIGPSRRASVLDWETAEPAGLPLCDLVFFLTYVAVARRGRWSRQTEVQAFDDAFWGRSAWARRYLRRYVDRLDVPSSAIDALVLLTWPRYLDGLLSRVSGPGGDHDPAATSSRWLRDNRYLALWRHASTRLGPPTDASVAAHATEW